MNRRKFIWLALATALACGTMSAASPKEPPPVKIRCSGITKAGTQCKRMVKLPNVVCYQHKAKIKAK